MSKSIWLRILVITHLIVIFYSLATCIEFVTSVNADFLGLNKVAFVLAIVMLISSAVAIFSLQKDKDWSFKYAGILAAFYLTFFLLSLTAYLT